MFRFTDGAKATAALSLAVSLAAAPVSATGISPASTSASVPTNASTHIDARADAIAGVRRANPQARIDVDAAGRVRTLARVTLPTSGQSALARADAFAHEKRAWFVDGAVDIRCATESRSRGQSIVQCVEQKDGIVVEGSVLHVTITDDGDVTRVVNELVGATTVLPSTMSDDAAALLATRLMHKDAPEALPSTVRLVRRVDGETVRAIRVVLAKPGTLEARAFYVDTNTGLVLFSSKTTRE